jgi:hypothetical protein
LENISKYHVWQIDKFYQDLYDKYTSDDNKRNNFNHLFGYDHIKSGQGAEQVIDSSLTSVVEVLKAIAKFYNFWKDSYNACKHGYRLWFGDERFLSLTSDNKGNQKAVQYLKGYILYLKFHNH